jgi:hypothetical protein
MKKIAMAPKIVPIQIIREQTLRGKGTQNLATRSWNLITGLYSLLSKLAEVSHQPD